MSAFNLPATLAKSESHQFPRNSNTNAAAPGTAQDDNNSISSNKRQEVLARDNYRCQNCGENDGKFNNTNLEVHHIVPRSLGGTNSKSNLATLCSECHAAAHGWNK